jgi:hypothetical protein
MVVWCDKPKAIIKRKGLHCVKKGNRRLKLKSGFHNDCGDVPVAIIEGNKLIPVENARGNAYAYRNALRYRKKLNPCRADKHQLLKD